MLRLADHRICVLCLCLVFSMLGATAVAADRGERPPLLAPLSDGAEVAVGEVDPAVPLPAEFLGYPLGERFTQYHRVREYFQALVNASDRVVEVPYGTTYEGRPLGLFLVSAPENLARLESLRQAHLALARGGEPPKDAPVVVWLAYGVHGNESSSTEAAMAAAYQLVAGRGEVEDWLRQAVVILDPLVNPDGRERYVQGFLQRRGRVPDAAPDAWEHGEPWPGGRYNHYGIDLNRDWAWATQQETRQRLAVYRQWEPQVYVDYHEMGSDSSYFFPPAAEPVLPQIHPSTVAWLDTFGRGNAAAMDAQGWMYYKGERFDLFYPGYGDSYPSLRGAVGMTYEMAGHGFAGQALDLPDGRRLTLADRIARHFTTSMATVATAVQHRERLLSDFATVRRGPTGPARTYAWEAEGPTTSEAWALAELLRRHGIAVQQSTTAVELSARRVADGEQERRSFAAGTLVATTEQPLGALLEVLLEKEAPMQASFLERQKERVAQNQDPEFYDVTAWSLTLAFNLEIWRAEGGAEGFGPLAEPKASGGGLAGEGGVGYLVPPQGLGSYRLAAALQEQSFLHRLAVEPFTLEGRSYPAGTLFIPTRGNPRELETWLTAALEAAALQGYRVASGYSSTGVSLGSDLLVPLRPGRIGLLAGDGLRPTAHGVLWFLLDQMVEAPVTRIDSGFLRHGDLTAFDVLILPDGRYGQGADKQGKERLEAWLRDGGVVVAISGAMEWLEREKILDLEEVGAKGGEGGEEGADGEPDTLTARRLEMPGAAVATALSAGHPLVLGVPAPPPVLVQGGRYIKATGDPRRDVLLARSEDPVMAGFAWPEARTMVAGTLLVGSTPIGRGRIVAFVHDPAFRLFWRGTLPLVLNAALYGPSLNAAGLLR